jgi:hypothetical protein
MAGAAIRGALAGAVVLLGATAGADEPVLPPPRPVVREVPMPISFVRPDPYAVWQNYGVDRMGRFRPLVVPTYDGLRYAATGEPYPWLQNYPGNVKPMIANAATFDAPKPAPLVIVMPAPAPVPAPSWERMPYAE